MTSTAIKSAGAVSAARAGAGSAHNAALPASVRPILEPACTECEGTGIVRGFATNDPSEPMGEAGCDRCNGTGYEPQEGCGPWCGCWKDAIFWPDAGWGFCSKDDEATTGAMEIGELARWRREEE